MEAWTRAGTGLEPLTAEALERWQVLRLREVLSRVRAHSRVQAGRLREVQAQALTGWADLARLPFTWPSDLVRDPFAFLCVPQRDVARVTTLTTSGTGGARKRIFFTQGDLDRTVAFFEQGMRTLAAPGQRALILMPGEAEHSIGRLLGLALARMEVRAMLGARDWTVHEALEAAHGVDCIVGMPAQLLCMCRTSPGLRPRTVLLSADYAPRSVIQALEATWGCQVLTHYGMTETGFGCAVQCLAQEGHHLRHAELIVEIVEPVTGVPVAPGTSGEIVITTLGHEAMPLLRYRTGDRARLLTGLCACGSVLPRLGPVDGRLDNTLDLGGGRTLSIHQLDELVFGFPSVRAFEAALRSGQEGPKLVLTLTSDRRLDRELRAAEYLDGVPLDIHYAESSPFPAWSKRTIHENMDS